MKINEEIIKDKERITTGSGKDISSKFIIYTENEVFENTDSWLFVKFNSADYQNKLEVGKTYIFKDKPVNLDSLLATRYKILHDIKVLEEMILGQRGLLNNVNNQLIKFFEDEYNTLQKSLVTSG